MANFKSVSTEDADIAYYVNGGGPLLFLIPGGNGFSTLYDGLVDALADRYTVATYDRRANNKSTGDVEQQLDMAQAARDVAAVLRAVDRGRAFVFGNSAGANIALKLTQDHPTLLRGLIDHEPPITNFLPEPAASKWRKFFDQIHDAYVKGGQRPALMLFGSSMVGVDQTQLSGPGDQEGGDSERFFAHEFVPLNNFVPDLEALRASEVPIVTGVGRLSGNAFYAECARYLAKRLPCRCEDFVANHIGYRVDPKAFADELHLIIETMQQP